MTALWSYASVAVMADAKPKRIRAESRRGMRAVVVWVPRALHRALMARAKATGETANVIVRAALAERLKRTKKGKA